MFFHSNSGVLQVVIGEPPSNAPYGSGYSFINLDRLFVIPWDAAAPMPPDTVYSGGLARSSKGALYVVEGTPSATEKSLGVPARTLKGVAYVTTAAIGQGSTFSSPWGMLSSAGEIHIDATFGLGFADLGAGVVSTVAGISGATPTFTRATTATTVLSNGLIGTVASGSPRSYYDPTTLTYLGYLAEGARTNLALRSEDLGTTWVNARSTESTNATTAPDGAATADKLVEDATAANNHYIAQSITFTNVVHTFSTFAKAAERTWVRLVIFDGTTTHSGYFNLGTGATGSFGNATGTIQAYPSGWYRITITTNAATAAAAGEIHMYLAEADNDVTYDGNGASGAFFWGMQLEAASFVSSYIATTTASVTRNADVLTYAPTTFISASAFTWFAQFASLTTVANSNGRYVSLRDSGANMVPIFEETGPLISVFDGANTGSGPAYTKTLTSRKAATAGSGVTMLSVVDGVAGTAGTFSGTVGIQGLGIGCNPAGTGQPFSAIRRVAYFPSRLANAQLQAMTQ